MRKIHVTARFTKDADRNDFECVMSYAIKGVVKRRIDEDGKTVLEYDSYPFNAVGIAKLESKTVHIFID